MKFCKVNRDSNKGYSFWTAAVFMISISAGLGLLSLSHALSGTGWYGIFFILLASVNSCYSSLLLGQTWLKMESQSEENSSKYRYPYPAMGMKAAGIWMRYLVTTTLHISAIGLVVVYLLMTAQVAQHMLSNFVSLKYTYWIIILAVILCPLTWLGGIEKFQFAGFGSMLTIVLACVGSFVGALLDYSTANVLKTDLPTAESVSLSFGTILFAFGSIYFFPTIQSGMRIKEHYTKSVLLANFALLILYIPIASAGYAVYGSLVNPNIALSISNRNLQIFIQICLAVHCFLAFLLGINPVMQEVEEILRVPPVFSYKRCIVRGFITLVILLIAYTIPHFHKIMNLLGGSTVTLLTFIFPSLIYHRINKQDTSQKDDEQKMINRCKNAFLLQIVLVGIAGGISCTYFAILDIAQTFKSHSMQLLDKRTHNDSYFET